MQIGPYTCCLTSDDKVLGEFGEERDEENGVVTCWVPSNEGHPFRVECVFGGTLNEVAAMRLVLSADGETLDTRVAVECDTTSMNGLRTDSWTILPYVFRRAVKPTEDFDDEDMDEDDAIDADKWKSRGIITLEMTRVEAIRFETLQDNEPSSPLPEVERLKTILVGDKDTSSKKAARRTVSWNWGNDKGRPCATFHFKHRPKDWLESYNIMPRDLISDIDFGMFSLNGQPEYLTRLQQLKIEDQVMS